MKEPISPIIIASLIILVGIVFYALSNRYYIDTSTRLVVDRLTGKITRAVIESTPAPSTESTSSPKSTWTAKDFEDMMLEYDLIYSSDEYNEKLDLLTGNESMVNKFKDYYNKCITNIKDDPLYYQTRSNEPDFENFSAYSPLLASDYIGDAYNENGISDPVEYIEYIRKIHKEHDK